MSQPPSGLEPQLGGRGTASDEARADADACFAQAIDAIRKQRWDAAKESLTDVLELVYDYPQAKGLLSLIRDIQGAIMRGQDERPQIEAMRAYIYAFENAPSALTPRPEPPVPAAAPATGAPITLPWVADFQQRNASRQTSYPPEHFRELPPVTEPQEPISAPLYVPDAGGRASAAEGFEAPFLSARNPLDQLRVLWWFFIQPYKVRGYISVGFAREIEPVLGWLASGLLWLPLAIPSLGVALGTMPSDGLVSVWMIALIIPMWLLCGWMMSNHAGSAALMLASAVWIVYVPMFINYVGFRSGVLIAFVFLLLAGFAAGINGIGADRASKHLALGATFVTTIAAVYKMYTFIAPIVWAYVDGFILGDTGGPILILMAVFFAGIMALGLTYVIPFVGTYFVSFAVEAVIEENLGGGANPLGAFALGIMMLLYALLIWVSFAGGWQVINTL